MPPSNENPRPPGAVDHDALDKSAEKVFGKLPTAGPSAADLVKAVRRCREGAAPAGLPPRLCCRCPAAQRLLTLSLSPLPKMK